MQEEEEDIRPDPIVIKHTRADRILRSQAARQRRKEVKDAKSLHTHKEEKEARERLMAKLQMEKLHRQKMKKLQNTS